MQEKTLASHFWATLFSYYAKEEFGGLNSSSSGMFCEVYDSPYILNIKSINRLPCLCLDFPLLQL